MNNCIEYCSLYQMNNHLNEYYGFWFELNIELNHFLAQFNENCILETYSHCYISLREACPMDKLFQLVFGKLSLTHSAIPLF